MVQASIFITGAGSGIGAATARLFAKKGWRVALADRDAAAAQALAQGIGGQAFRVDVLEEAQIRAALTSFCVDGTLTVLFNSAGLLDMHPFADADAVRLDALFDVNVKGVMRSVRSALPYLKGSENAHIVTMSSAAAIHGVPDLAAYSASKFAVRGLTEALNIEFEPMGIWVCDLMVGYVSTPMVTNAEVTATSVELAGVHVTPEMVAEAVYEATQERQVHWFVRQEDRDAQALFDATPLQKRRAVMRTATGY